MIDITEKMQQFHSACEEAMDGFFKVYPDAKLQEKVKKAGRFLMVSGEALKGDPRGWAAGLVYWMANRDRQPCGIPGGLLNLQVEKCFGVTMSTIRKRAAQVEPLVTV